MKSKINFFFFLQTLFFHNRECSFYAFSKQIRGVPLPHVFAMEKSIPSMSLGGILMEDLSEKTTSLKLYDTLTLQQVGFLSYLN